MATEKTEKATEAVDLKGRLVLATGEIEKVPAESVSVSTEHFSAQLGATVPVVSSFVIRD